MLNFVLGHHSQDRKLGALRVPLLAVLQQSCEYCCGGILLSVTPPRGYPMRRRAKYAVGIVIVVLSLFLPNLLLAQGEFTLESLAESVQELTYDVNALAREIVRITDQIDRLKQEVQSIKEVQQHDEQGEHDAGRPCFVASKEDGITTASALLRTETLNEYYWKYGDRYRDGVFVYDILFHPVDGTFRVRYKSTSLDDNIWSIIEIWKGCDYIGVEFEEKD